MSMTGFAAREGAADGWRWSWELRAVNGRGLDIRLRLPDWPGGLDLPLRAALQEKIGRGNVSLSLRLQRDSAADATSLNSEALSRTIDLVRRVEEQAAEADLGLHPTRATDILTMRGVMENGPAAEEPEPLRNALTADVPGLIDAFNAMRETEGNALSTVIGSQIDAISASVTDARSLLDERTGHMSEQFSAALGRVVGATDAVSEERIAQELAILSVKSDVAEELDRLDAHVDAARGLLSEAGPKGRKLEFLTQEFNREANTLCSKASYAPLTRIGLDLKHTIDQMREQVQNVE